jgi:hypothetical protein
MDGGMAPIYFDGHDAGSGPVIEEVGPSPVTTAIHNISARHMHDIANGMPDNRLAIRAWRQQIQECVKRGHCQLFKFMITNNSDAGPDIMKRIGDTVSKYSKATWNFASSVRDLSIDTNCDETYTELATELGHPVSELADLQKRVNYAYTRAATAVCDAEERLEAKLQQVNAVDNCLNQLLDLAHTPALDAAKGPIQAYLDSVYAEARIEAEYTALIRAYKRFAALKGLVSLGSIQQTPAPTCTICMSKEITHATLPCGHTYCEECSRSQVTSCYTCRVQVRDRVRLFFS